MAYLTKQEVAADLATIYKKAVSELEEKSVMIKDQQGVRVAPQWVVMKECVTLLNRIDALDDVDKLVPKLDLD